MVTLFVSSLSRRCGHCRSFSFHFFVILVISRSQQTPSSMTAFILAMLLRPEVQARAQRELDTVLGPSWTRLPTFADRARLPYIQAIVLEVLRWNPAVPLGLAHRLTQDDVYRGWVIRKGTVVWANIWYVPRDVFLLKVVTMNMASGRCCKTRRCSPSRLSFARSGTSMKMGR